MKKLFDILRLTWQGSEGRNLLYNFVPRRGVRYQESIKWVKPEKKPIYHPSRSGDLVGFPKPKLDSIYLPFRGSKELESADEKVKKIFSLGYQNARERVKEYQHELVEKVKTHSHDNYSHAVKIAKNTALIRYYQSIIIKRPSKYTKLAHYAKMLIEKRKKQLKMFRLKDYKKFEWLLEQLDLEFRPAVSPLDNKVTRKKSLTQLAHLKVLRLKEERISALKKAFDDEKIPFLEKKILKLKEIKEMEEKNNLPVTVTDANIQECIEKLEKVKIEIAHRARTGYKRKIHPYLLEPIDENLLWEKEKAAEELREKQELERENQIRGKEKAAEELRAKQELQTENKISESQT